MRTKKVALAPSEKRALKKLKDELIKNFHLIDFKIFGSKARGENTFESDIDVMLEVDDLNSEIESTIDDIIYEINLENDTFISAIIFTKEELINGPMAESPLYKAIARDGVRF